jgi:D-alanine transaminase
LFEVDRHLDRLRFGLSELRIAAPELSRSDVLEHVANQLLVENGHSSGEATVYVEVTRGVAPRTHQFPAAATSATAFMMTNAFKPQDELRARGIVAITAPDLRWLRCDLKTIQLLPNVLAKQAAAEQGATECLLVRDGVVTEGSHSNVMAVLDDTLRTHPLSNLVLPGITRAVVLEIARELRIPVVEEGVAESELPQVDELFLTGTTTDVMPIVQLNDRHVGSGVPGPITTRLYEEFRVRMDAACASAPPVSPTVASAAARAAR